MKNGYEKWLVGLGNTTEKTKLKKIELLGFFSFLFFFSF